MRIGAMTVCSIVDGEMHAPPRLLYPFDDVAGLGHFSRSTDRHTGDLVITIGGYLIRAGDRVVLIDAGAGPAPKSPVVAGGALRSSLLAHGVTPEDVTDVIYTHLHFDHIGWSTIQGEPFFPHATYRCDRRDWEYFTAEDYDTRWEEPLTNVSTDAARVRMAPLAERMLFFEGSESLLPGIETVDASGHTPGSVVLMLSSNGERGALLGDLVHTQSELVKGWVFRNHVDSRQAMARVTEFRDRLADEAIPCSASHFPGLCWGLLSRQDAGFGWRDIGNAFCCAPAASGLWR
jgi:glyoxylase-like metal-dependent hydrolase (beta-lactamase superfamily II)